MGSSVAEELNLDTGRIADLVVTKAGAGDEMFRKDTFGERLLRCLVQRAYEEAKRDRDFATVIGIPVQQVLLERTDALLAGQAELPRTPSSTNCAGLDARGGDPAGGEWRPRTGDDHQDRTASQARWRCFDFDQAGVVETSGKERSTWH